MKKFSARKVLASILSLWLKVVTFIRPLSQRLWSSVVTWWNLPWRQRLLRVLILAVFVFLPLYFFYLDYTVTQQFEGKRWALPARVYARPLELFPNKPLNPAQFELELKLLGYRDSSKIRPGNYVRKGSEFQVVTRAFNFWDGKEESQYFQASFSANRVRELRHGLNGQVLSMLRFDPVMVGSIYPTHKEDRILVQLKEDVPQLLIDSLIAVEDKSFFEHFGVDPRGIIRALWSNIRAGGMVQGGSTLTQQLVKNYFLSNERKLWRKFNEAVMAFSLELHYSKEEILESYCNEIYLGQDGERAIHGFGLASWFYFKRPLKELRVAEAALLVGMVRGPSLYDPRRHPARAIERRNHVLDQLFKNGKITARDVEEAKASPLGIAPNSYLSVTNYPAFLDLVKRQLKQEYREQDLSSEGLQVFTTMDPMVQVNAEIALEESLNIIEQRYGKKSDSLEGAIVVSSTENGEVLAIVGGRKTKYQGFNRALDSVRPAGSLLKPAVFLTALEQPDKYTLASLIDDSPLTVQLHKGKTWSPMNYDKTFHGEVPLYKALAHSYNVATIRVGMDVGINRVMDTIKRLGVDRQVNPFPSLLLGATPITPFEVTQMYQTFASGGFKTPLRGIREVIDAKGQLLQRYPLAVTPAIDAGPVYLINRAMQEVVNHGTASSIYSVLSPSLNIAGKTGTTDEMRDSWFAGFTGDRVGVVWVGKDDNSPAGLSGAVGALPIWTNLFSRVGAEPLVLELPNNVEERWIDGSSSFLGSIGCFGAVKLPFIEGSAPEEVSSCGGVEDSVSDSAPEHDEAPIADQIDETIKRGLDWVKDLFGN